MTDSPLESTDRSAPPAVALWEPSPQSKHSRPAASKAATVTPHQASDEASLRDPLTGLIGPALFADRLRHAVAGAQREQRTIMVALLDLDRFGLANQDHDDEVGNQILKVVASRLTDALRAIDTVARLGSDEFAIVVERPGDPELICRRLVESIGEPMDIDGVSLWMSASVGAAIGNGEDPEEFLRFATIALQRSKERGGDSCTVLGRT